jgi:GT2 family glycosyltransferase
VIVVDNGSQDGTGVLVQDRFPEVDLVRLPENRGFAAAVNEGIAHGASPFVVLVNNDVECDAEFVERIVAPLRSDESVAMVAGLLLKPGRRVIDSFGLELDRTLAAFPRFAGASHPGTVLDERHLAGPSGGAAAYRRSALEHVGGFDARLFAYMEDADLALAIHSTGGRCVGAKDAIGVHLGSATIGRRSRTQVEIAGASRAYMIRKYGVLASGPAVAAWTLGVEAGVSVAEMVLGRDLAAFRGRARGWRRAAGRRATVPSAVINESIGVLEALRRRRAAVGAPG